MSPPVSANVFKSWARRKDILSNSRGLSFALPTFNTSVLKEKLTVFSAISSQSTKHCLSIMLFVISCFLKNMKCVLAATIMTSTLWSFDHFYFNISVQNLLLFLLSCFQNEWANFIKKKWVSHLLSHLRNVTQNCLTTPLGWFSKMSRFLGICSDSQKAIWVHSLSCLL